MPGGSFHRSVRTTLEYVANSNTVDSILIPITFIHRHEFVLDSEDDRPVEGPYVSTNNSEELNNDYQRVISKGNGNYDVYDKFLVTLIGFSSWLETQGIEYLIWNQCNIFYPPDYKNFQACNKIKWIKNNPRIIDLFSFCGNQFMYDSGANTDCEGDLIDNFPHPPNIPHYHTKDYDRYLLPFLQSYINENDLNITL